MTRQSYMGDAAILAEQKRVSRDLPRPRAISFDLERSPAISYDLERSPAISPDLERSPPISSDLPRSRAISRYLERSPEISHSTSPAAIDPALPPPRRADTRRSVEDGGDGKERQAGCGRAAVERGCACFTRYAR